MVFGAEPHVHDIHEVSKLGCTPADSSELTHGLRCYSANSQMQFGCVRPHPFLAYLVSTQEEPTAQCLESTRNAKIDVGLRPVYPTRRCLSWRQSDAIGWVCNLSADMIIIFVQ